MLSVLIPTYNYNVYKLVESIHQQLTQQNIAFEIIVFEDGSTSIINSNLNFSNTKHIINKENIGRISARTYLAEQSQYDWLLFLDADVLPKTEVLIEKYLSKIDNAFDAIFGGFAYKKSKPHKDFLLRWAYGKSKEEKAANIRNKTPYKVIISANFIIKKLVFLNVFSNFSLQKGYGYDSYFAMLLKQKKYRVLHIDNEVFHLGIEQSKTFINKTEQAVNTLLSLYESEHDNNEQNDLLNLFSKLKTYKLIGFFSGFYSVFGAVIKRNLLSSNPSIILFQLYKISYMCNKHKK